MTTVLITGANRGLGLEFCRQYAHAGWRVIACCRTPETAAHLRELADTSDRVTILPLDVARLEQIDAVAASLETEAVDVLVNNAGIYGDSSERGFGHLDYSYWLDVLRVNLQAPVKMTEAFEPHLLRGERRLTVAVTSLMGSIADNQSGGSIMYRSSKAALNAAMRTLAIDLRPKGLGVLLLHPGWVKTDMGGPNAPTSVEESVGGMRRVIDEFRLPESGSFLNFRGERLPW